MADRPIGYHEDAELFGDEPVAATGSDVVKDGIRKYVHRHLMTSVEP